MAGGFGNYITPHNAVAIGLLPDAAEKVVRIGNAALAGAWEMLVCQESGRQAGELAEQIEHVKPTELEAAFPYMVVEKIYF